MEPVPLTIELLKRVMSGCIEIAKTFAIISSQDLENFRQLSHDFYESKEKNNNLGVEFCIQKGSSWVNSYGIEIPHGWWNVMFEICHRELIELETVKKFYIEALRLFYPPPPPPPPPQEPPVPISIEMLLSIKNDCIQEFLALRENIVAACQNQALEGSVSLHFLAQPSTPVVVRVYALRDPHFTPDFEVQVQPAEAQLIGNMDAYLLDENFDSKFLASVPVNSMNVASFSSLRLPQRFSARMNETYILFIGFAFHNEMLTVVAAVSNPFIAITNISEAPSAQSKLIWGTFPSAGEQGFVQWELLVPYFVSYFERTTSNKRGSRPLSQRDVHFLHSKVKYHASLSRNEFKDLWLWLFKIADTCHKRIGEAWSTKITGTDNYIVDGFLGREGSEVCLQGHPPGTFLIRFSDREPHALVASFIMQEGTVGHKLIHPKDFEKGHTLGQIITVNLSYMLRSLLTPNGLIPANAAFGTWPLEPVKGPPYI